MNTQQCWANTLLHSSVRNSPAAPPPADRRPIGEPSSRPRRCPNVCDLSSKRELLPANRMIMISRNTSSSPTTSSLKPLSQVLTRASSTELIQPTTSLVSIPTGTPLFNAVTPYATSTTYPATNAAVTNMGVATVLKKSFPGQFQLPFAAAVVLGVVVGFIVVL